MKIVLVEIENYKCIKKLSIIPGEGALFLIGGMNKSGKTSLLGAITTCIGGKGEEPRMPIRKGETSANIRINLIDEAEKLEYQVHKRFLLNGNSSLKVTGRDGKLTSPQKVLDKILGGRMLDPIKFADLGDKEQKIALLKVVDIGINLEEWAAERKKHFDARTDANRDLKRHQVELGNNPDPGEIPEEVSGNLVEDVNTLLKKSSDRREVEGQLKNLRESSSSAKANITKMKEALAIVENDLEDIKKRGNAKIAELEDLPDVSEQLAEAQVALSESSVKQEERLKLVAQQERHVIAAELVQRAESLSGELTGILKTMDEKKAAKLAEAKMPVEGLTIGDDCLFYNGVPLADASQSEQLEVSLALAVAMSSNLKDICVKDGSRLDENSLKQVGEFAEKYGMRFWVERVGESDEGALILEEGIIKV